MNRYKDESIKLKTKLLQYEAILGKKDKVLRELYKRHNLKPQLADKKCIDQPMVVELKKRIKEIREGQKLKVAEIEELKNSFKTFKFKELELQLRAHETECTNLKRAILNLARKQSAIASPEDVVVIETKIKEQSIVMQRLEEEKIKLLSLMDEKEEELVRYKETAVQLDKRVGQVENSNRENIKARRAIIENIKKIEKFRKLISYLQVNNDENESTVLKKRINEMIKKQVNMNRQLKQKDSLIKKIEGNITRLPSKELLNEIKQVKSKLDECNLCLYRGR